MAERFDIYTRDGVHRGVKDRADVHRDGDWHRSVHIWIVRQSERALLIQQRAPGKDTWPGYWDASVGGHLSAGERYEDAYREIEEELGVTIDPQTFVPLGIIAIELTPPNEPQVTDRELCLVALARDDRPLDAYPFDRTELSAVASLPLTGLRALIDGQSATIAAVTGAQRRPVELHPGRPHPPALPPAPHRSRRGPPGPPLRAAEDGDEGSVKIPRRRRKGPYHPGHHGG